MDRISLQQPADIQDGTKMVMQWVRKKFKRNQPTSLQFPGGFSWCLGYDTTEQDTRGVAGRTSSVGKAPQTAALGEASRNHLPLLCAKMVPSQVVLKERLHCICHCLERGQDGSVWPPESLGRGRKAGERWKDMSVFED